MKKKRYHLLDGLRGITLLGMIAYHGMFDLVELYGVPVRWFFRIPGYVWQQSVCWTFILLSGFCWRLGRLPVRRGLLIFAGGLTITAVNFLFMQSERILFGILTFIGTAMLALVPVSGLLKQIPAWGGLIGSGFLFFLTRNINRGYWGFESVILGQVPEGLYRGWVMTFLGFPKAGFFPEITSRSFPGSFCMYAGTFYMT